MVLKFLCLVHSTFCSSGMAFPQACVFQTFPPCTLLTPLRSWGAVGLKTHPQFTTI